MSLLMRYQNWILLILMMKINNDKNLDKTQSYSYIYHINKGNDKEEYLLSLIRENVL